MIRAGLLLGLAACITAAASEDRGLSAVPFDAVSVEDEFWKPWTELNRSVIIPHNLRLIDETGVLENFLIAAGRKAGRFEGFHSNDEGLYKTLEAASFALAQKYEAALDKRRDEIIAAVAAAQQPDGYLCTPGTIAARTGDEALGRRFPGTRLVHELYLFGHLFEAAVAHHRATGKRSLLAVAIRAADLADRTLGPGKIRDVPQHPNVEQALVKLYEATGEVRYLRLARFLTGERGHANGRQLYGEFAQDHIPLAVQFEAAGQAPRATYLYSAAADLARIEGASEYVPALERLWNDVVTRKMYITGGIGSRHENEGFGPAYELPNRSAYTETCAAVSFSMWNHRMFLLHGDAKYLDVLERTLYNNFLAGSSLEGDAFFYANPLESDGAWKFNRGWMPKDATGPYVEGAPVRKRWFFCACCPPNVARKIAWTLTYFYATGPGSLYVNFFVSSTAVIRAGEHEVRVRQLTRYPWDGRARIAVDPSAPARLRLHLRIPGWARGRPVPGDLYRYVGAGAGAVSLRVNGKPAALRLDKGFAVMDRLWQAGDVIEVDLPMAPRRVVAHPKVQANAGRVAVERGPLVYCAEGADNGGKALGTTLPETAGLTAVHRPDLLRGVTVIRAGELVLIPYYAWANRGAGEMSVWLRSAGGPETDSPPARSLKFSTIEIEGQRDVAQPSARVIRNEDDWRKFLTETLGYSGAAPVVDFRSETVVAIFAGQKPTGGYSVRVEKVTEESRPGQSSRATVHYRVMAPPADAMLIQVLTYPYTLIRVEKKLDAVDFRPPIEAHRR